MIENQSLHCLFPSLRSLHSAMLCQHTYSILSVISCQLRIGWNGFFKPRQDDALSEFSVGDEAVEISLRGLEFDDYI